ncbi:hypothetical protein A4X13_0g4745 [Tilletia indica]|uniref:Uncharacterized protein n=1 Tax=Tilletia indica TaxID=43049 RepID=A0A177TP69_9BASI|nr:hypothetical protein A4X13_0g4745 [Tilletia indica]
MSAPAQNTAPMGGQTGQQDSALSLSRPFDFLFDESGVPPCCTILCAGGEIIFKHQNETGTTHFDAH